MINKFLLLFLFSLFVVVIPLNVREFSKLIISILILCSRVIHIVINLTMLNFIKCQKNLFLIFLIHPNLVWMSPSLVEFLGKHSFKKLLHKTNYFRTPAQLSSPHRMNLSNLLMAILSTNFQRTSRTPHKNRHNFQRTGGAILLG